MPHTAQNSIDKMRILLAETDKNNSRWQDSTHLLYYYNLGRREFSKQSEAIKAIFEQTTSIGATPISTIYARYTLDPTIIEIDKMKWDGTEVELGSSNEWDDETGGYSKVILGRPYMFRRIGDSIDLFYAPDGEKLLEIEASIITTDLPLITSIENELNEDQSQAAIEYGAFQALTDDNRDGSIPLSEFNRKVMHYKKKIGKKGVRYVESNSGGWY